MRALVTGGAGFVGLNICEALLDRGHDVIVADLNGPPAVALAHFDRLAGAATYHRLDITNVLDVTTVVKDARPDVVIHAAAQAPSAATELAAASRTATVNVGGTMNVLDAAHRAKVARVVLISSAAVYGRAGAAEPVLDEAKTRPLPEAIYSITKLASETLAMRFQALSSLEIVRIRIGSVYGPWELQTAARDTLSPMLQIERLHAAGSQVVLPRPGRRDWIYSRDVGAAVADIALKARLAHDLYNLATGTEFTVADWCVEMSKAVPNFDWRLADLGERANVDLFATFDRAPLAIDRLSSELGMAPARPLDQAVAMYRAWLASFDDYRGQND